MESGADGGLSEAQVRWILKVRRDRARVFGASLFSDPAWDILLELLAARLGGRDIELADLAYIAPSSTLARWVAALEERGLVRCKGPMRPDRMQVALTGESAALMTSFLSGAPDGAR